MLVKEIVFAVLDLAKLISDDSTINESHALFLLKKYRTFLIKREQDKERSKTDAPSEFEHTQQICLDLEEVEAIEGQPCTEQYYMRTTKPIPKIIEGNKPRLYTPIYYQGINICFIGRDRMRYVGTNKYLQNIIYASLAPDGHLYFTSNNPQFTNLDKIRMNAVFDDFEEALDYLCDDDCCPVICDIMDAEFPIRGDLVPTMIELAVKEIVGAAYRPKDSENNASDDLASLATFIRNNVKSALQKQIQG